MPKADRYRRVFAAVLWTAIIIVVPRLSPAKAAPTSYDQLLRAAEVIVTGTVVAVGEDTFDLRVGESLRGVLAPGETTTVLQFCNWTCGRRWAPYQPGQQLLFFLQSERPGMRRRQESAHLSASVALLAPLLVPMGSLDEGEMLISGGKVLVPSSCLPAEYIRRFRPEAGTSGAAYSGFSVDLIQVFETVAWYTDLREGVLRTIRALPPQARQELLRTFRSYRELSPELATLADHSPLHESIVEGAIREARRLEEQEQTRAGEGQSSGSLPHASMRNR